MVSLVWAIWIWGLFQGLPVAGMIAYDCEGPDIQFTKVDLHRPAACPNPESDYEKPIDQEVQILQTAASMPLTAYLCRVTISKKVSRCGYDSITYGTKWTQWDRNLELTPQECREAISDGRIKVEGSKPQRSERTKLQGKVLLERIGKFRWKMRGRELHGRRRVGILLFI